MSLQGIIYDELKSTEVFTQGEASYYATGIAKRLQERHKEVLKKGVAYFNWIEANVRSLSFDEYEILSYFRDELKGK